MRPNITYFLKTCTYILYIAGIVGVINCALYYAGMRKYIPKLKNKQFSYIEKNVGIGIALNNKKSSYKNFPFEKKDGVTRIGCFGDSFTVGDGADRDNDYPGILQRLLNEHGYKAEVLNFGIGGSGCAQSFIFWQEYNKKYDLDYVIFGPGGFWPERDVTFNLYLQGKELISRRAASDWVFQAIHGRFILKNGGLHFIDVSGETLYEVINRYIAFIPPWRYIRYDKYAPRFISGPLMVFAPERFVENPFYYSRDPDEIMKIYSKLLTRLAAQSKNFFLLYGPHCPFAFNKIEVPSEMDYASIAADWFFPNSSLDGHHSPQGYAAIAKQCFDYLTGKKGTVYTRFQYIEPDGGGYDAAVKCRPLSDYRYAVLELGGQDIGYFYDNRNAFSGNWDVQEQYSLSCKFLLAVRVGANIFNSFFIPLDFIPPDKSQVVLKVHFPGKSSNVFLGNVQYLGSSLVGSIQWLFNVPFKNYDQSRFFIDKSVCPGANAFEIFVADKEVMRSRRTHEGAFEMITSFGNGVCIVADSTKFVDVDTLPESGTVFLKLYDKNGLFEKYPFVRYHKEKMLITFTRPIKNPLKR